MSKAYLLYNPLANNGRSAEAVNKLASDIGENAVLCDMTQGYKEILSSLESEDTVIICGGDGTLNRFINDTDGIEVENDILYYASGSGNDFAKDISLEREAAPVSIKKYLKDLPVVEVKGKSYKFLNAIGYGIDGYCCEVGDKLRAEQPGVKINYGSIAIKGVFGKFDARNATVIVDGVERKYEKVWIAPAMNGRYYGGGMNAAPEQSRENNEKLSLVVWHGSCRLLTFLIFPSIFKGKHVKHKKYIDVIEGREITVMFDRPCALQVDGETVLDVESYTAKVAVCAKV